MARIRGAREALAQQLAQGAGGRTNPDAQQLEALIAADRDGPLHFLNLLRFRAHARYPDGHELASRALSGAEAYGLYGAVAFQHIHRRGGRIVELARVEQELVGEGAGWHEVAIVEYPDTAAFLDMLSDPGYQAALVHREAGLEATQLLVTRPVPLPGPA